MVAGANAAKVQAIIGHIRQKFPHLEQVLERVGQLAITDAK